jgi:hypothetical protein
MDVRPPLDLQRNRLFLVQGKATSSRATGREEPSPSLFNYDRDTLGAEYQSSCSQLAESASIILTTHMALPQHIARLALQRLPDV